MTVQGETCSETEKLFNRETTFYKSFKVLQLLLHVRWYTSDIHY
jgi:hypothetical protein